MKEPTYSIDLKKKKNLFFLLGNDVPVDLKESFIKSAEQTLIDLTSNGGFLLIPHPATQPKSEKSLTKKGNIKQNTRGCPTF